MVVQCINCGKRRAMLVVNFKMRCPNCKYQSSRWDYPTEENRNKPLPQAPFDLAKFREEQALRRAKRTTADENHIPSVSSI